MSTVAGYKAVLLGASRLHKLFPLLMTAAGTGVRRLADGHWTWVRAEYSPDGRFIVAAADRGGFLSALWVMRSNGTGLHRITSPSLEAFWPDWSPNGTLIAYCTGQGDPHGFRSISIMHARWASSSVGRS